MEISIDFKENAQQYQPIVVSEEFDFTSPSIVIDLLLSGKYTRNQVGEILIIARELGYMKGNEINFKTNKANLINGTGLNVKAMNEAAKRGYKFGRDGKVVMLKQAVAVVNDQVNYVTQQIDVENNDQCLDVTHKIDVEETVHYTPTKSELAKDSAYNYVMHSIPHHLFKYLMIYGVNDGDVKELARKFKREVDRVVKEVLKED